MHFPGLWQVVGNADRISELQHLLDVGCCLSTLLLPDEHPSSGIASFTESLCADLIVVAVTGLVYKFLDMLPEGLVSIKEVADLESAGSDEGLIQV